jgi:hypothetical protein
MRTCIVGRPGWNDVAETVVLQSSQTLLDYDLVLMDLNGISNASDLNSCLRRRDEVSELLTLGRTVVAFVSHCNLDHMLPVSGLTTVASSGQRVDFKSSQQQLKDFWHSIQDKMRYQAHLKGNSGQPFLFVSETDKPVATWIKKGQGNLFLVPWLIWDGNSNAQHRDNLTQFVQFAKKLVQQLAPKKSDFTIPAWSAHYGWSHEREIRTSLLTLQQQAENFQKQ